MRILWISPRWPWPDDDGAKKATLALVKQLKSIGEKSGDGEFRLDGVLFLAAGDRLGEIPNPSPFDSQLFLRRAAGPFRRRAFNYLLEVLRFRRLPFTTTVFTGKRVRREFLDWAGQQNWDVTVLDGLHAGALLDGLDQQRFGRIVHRSHNVESELWAQMAAAESNRARKFVFTREWRKVSAFERAICARSAVTLTVSEEDVRKFGSLGFEGRFRALPIGWFFGEEKEPNSGAEAVLRLLFVGRLDWHPNREGLGWFMESVWPRLAARRAVRLQVVGSGDSAWFEKWLVKYPESVSLHRNAPSLEAFYGEADLSLIPLRYGSGTRVKAIESAAKSVPFISTSLGVQGLPFSPGEHYLLAETADEWIDALTCAVPEELARMRSRAYAKARSEFEQVTLVGRFVDILKTLK